MSKWGDRKVHGPERIIEPKIYPVGLFWDGRKIKKFIWFFLSGPVSLLRQIWESKEMSLSLGRLSFKDRLSYRVKDAIDIFWIFVFSACLVAVGWAVLFVIFYWIKKIFFFFY